MCSVETIARCELFYRSLKFRRDSRDGRFVRGDWAVVASIADNQSHFSRSKHPRAFWPGAVRAVEIARHDVDITTSDERAHAGSKWLHHAARRARALGKQNQNIAGFCEQLVTEVHRVPSICAARKRQRVAEHGRDPAAETRLEKVVTRRCGENVAQSPERKRST